MKSSLSVLSLTALAALLLAGCADPTAGAIEEHTVSSEFSQELHDALPEDIKQSKVVSVVGEINGPWRVVEEDDKLTGFQADLLEEFSTILGVEFDAEIAGGLPAVKLGVQSGRNDVAFGPLLSNDATQKDLTFIDYALGRPAFVYMSDAEPVQELTDLCGRTIAVIEGSAAFDPLIEKLESECEASDLESIDILMQTDTNASLVAVQSGRADAAGTAGHRAVYFEAVNAGKFSSYITTDQDIAPDHLGMAFDPGNVELAEALYGAWEEVHENGTYDALIEKYNLGASALDQPVLHLTKAK